MRLFIAIEIPQEIREKIREVQGELKKAPADIRWVKPENIHLTLRFLGEVAEEKLPELFRAGEESGKGFPPFETKVSGAGVFPNINRPRVIWIGIGKGAVELEKLSKSLSGQLAKIGFPEEQRKFVGHLTFGRVKSLNPVRSEVSNGVKGKGKLREALKKFERVEFGRFLVNSFSLIKSQLTPTGPIYTVLKRYSLEFRV